MTLPATSVRPATKTRTRRRDLAAKARKRLAAYQAEMDPKYRDPDAGSAQRLNDLLWARALIDQALAAETRGALGDHYATASTEADDAAGVMARRRGARNGQ